MDADRRALERASAHHGVVVRDEALAAGLTPAQIRHRVSTGRWEVIWPGVYRPAGQPSNTLQQLFAATLATNGVASHRSAGLLHGLLDREPTRPEISVATRRGHHLDGIRLHRCGDLSSCDITTVEGVPTTNAVRTVIDLGDRLSQAQLLVVTERALRMRLVHHDRLTRRFFQLARRGRNGIATARAVLTHLDPTLAPAESDLETLTIEVLRRHGLPAPVRQLEVIVGGRTFRLDLAYPTEQLVIECDGFATHGTRDAFERDRERQNLLVLDGWTMLRFTWQQICRNPDWVAEQVGRALQSPTSG